MDTFMILHKGILVIKRRTENELLVGVASGEWS